MISSSVIGNIELALKLARKYSHEQQNHHAAVLAKGKRVISIGVNKKKTHTRSNTRFGFIHAELDCILGVDKELLRNATLYVVRAGYNFQRVIMLSRPCQYCQTLISNCGIRRVIYTINSRTVGIWYPKKDIEKTVELKEEIQ